jgi:hypothetical protein
MPLSIRHCSPRSEPETEKDDLQVSVLSRRRSMLHMQFTEWRKRARVDGHTTALAELERAGSCKASTKRKRKETRRLISRRLGGSTARPSLDKSRIIEVEQPPTPRLESRSPW